MEVAQNSWCTTAQVKYKKSKSSLDCPRSISRSGDLPKQEGRIREKKKTAAFGSNHGKEAVLVHMPQIVRNSCAAETNVEKAIETAQD